MRLIDGDRFKQQIAAAIIRDNLVAEKGNAMCNLIDKQPTAYDVDRVVERLEANSMYGQEEIEPFVILDDAVGIVKSGGME